MKLKKHHKYTPRQNVFWLSFGVQIYRYAVSLMGIFDCEEYIIRHDPKTKAGASLD